MKRKLARIFALALTGAMILSLASCREKGLSAQDASECVQVELDTTYKGIFDGFVKFYTNVETSDARDQYNAKIESEAEYFMAMYGVPDLEDTSYSMEPSDMQAKRARDLYKDIYAKADYSIVSSSKQDDGTFAVKVTIKPINIIKLLDDNFDAGFEKFWAKFDAVDTDSMSDEEFVSWYTNTFAKEYYDTLLDLLEEQLPNLGYEDEKSIVIQIDQDENDILQFTDEDWSNLDRLIIDYNY